MSDPEPTKKLSPLAARFSWTDDPVKVNFAIRCLAITCGVLFLADFIIHRHSYFSVEGWPGFYAVTGFVAFTLIVLAAKNLRRLIRRDENFYGGKAVDSEEYPTDTQQLTHRPESHGSEKEPK